ncbi:DUF7287 family protein [Halorussus amylolyticus]|uniref:DUF7287 family protein n=1 Tax=Halorussus amylolyticus TaxID=1126242 RepID=UPI0010460169|nr:hypothetical protein [Halorussus amylolyticus]
MSSQNHHRIDPGRSHHRTERGQTSIDFVVGMSVFLLTVAFVVGFLPGLFEPFDGGDGAAALSADRTAAGLTGDLLGSPDRPDVLDATCTAEFFDADGDTADCRFDADASDLSGALGLGSGTNVNVTVEEDGSVRSVAGQKLRAGPAPSESGSVTVGRRVVLLADEESTLFVRMW